MFVKPISLLKNVISNKNTEKLHKITKKRAYIESKTNTLRELSNMAVITTILSSMHNVNIAERKLNMTKLNAWLTLSSAALLVVSLIKQIQLSKEYDRKVKK